MDLYLEGKRRMKSMRWILFWVMLTQLVVSVVMSAVVSFLPQAPHVYLQTFIIELIAYPVPILLYAKTGWSGTEIPPKQEFGLRKFPYGLIPVLVIMAAGCQFVQIVFNLPLTLLFRESAMVIHPSVWDLLAGLLVLGLIPAVFEEVLMRGIVYGVTARYSTRAAMIFTTVMFAMLHANPSGLIGYLLLGVILVVVRRRTESVYATILFHFVNNLTALLYGFFAEALVYMPVATIMLFVIGAILFAVALLAFLFFTDKPEEVGRERSSAILGQSFICLPTIFCFVIVIVMTWMQMT